MVEIKESGELRGVKWSNGEYVGKGSGEEG